MIKICKEVFGKFSTTTYYDGKTHVTKFPAVIGTALELSGVPRGDKRLKNSFLPKDIFLGNKNMQINYLRRVFDDEGDVCFDNYGKRAVRISRSRDISNFGIKITQKEKWIRYKLPSKIIHNLLYGEQLLLLKLGIDARLYPEGIYKSKNNKITAKWRIQIGQQDHLRRFAKLINFSLPTKKEKLNKALNSYQFRKLPNGEGKRQAFETISNVYKEKGYFKFGDLGNELVKSGRSYDLAGRYINFFIQEGIIQKIKRGTYIVKRNFNH